MADVTLPQLGETVTEGTITQWFKNVGDTVAADEPLFEVSTDKVDTEVPSPVSGVLTEIRVPEGETVDVGTVIAVVGDSAGAPAGDAPSADTPAAPAEEPAAPAPVEEAAAPAAGCTRPRIGAGRTAAAASCAGPGRCCRRPRRPLLHRVRSPVTTVCCRRSCDGSSTSTASTPTPSPARAPAAASPATTCSTTSTPPARPRNARSAGRSGCGRSGTGRAAPAAGSGGARSSAQRPRRAGAGHPLLRQHRSPPPVSATPPCRCRRSARSPATTWS